MPRPFKSGVDYFPLDVNIDDKIEILEAEHGIIGFGIWVKLLQKIYANNYWINWDNKAVIVFSNRVNVDKNKVIEVINSCIEWNIFSQKMFETFNILTSRGIQKRFFEITKRRNRIEVIEDYLLVDKPLSGNIVLVNVDNNQVNVRKSTQRKVKESKGKGKKEKLKPENVSDQTWSDFITHRNKKKAAITQTVINGFKKQADLAGMTLEDAMIESCNRNWIGFKADWMKGKQGYGQRDENGFYNDIPLDVDQGIQDLFGIGKNQNAIELKKGVDYE